jgi:hypothetical protein
MAGPKSRYLYQLTPASGGSTTRCWVECDDDHLTLVVNNNTNPVGTVVGAAGMYNMVLPVEGSARGRNAAARWVQVEFTGALPPGRTSNTVKVPVFTMQRYGAWTVGMTGTYLGLPVRVVRKFDGRPTITGASQ